MSLRERQSFLRDMDSYLSERNRKKWSFKLPQFLKKKESEDMSLNDSNMSIQDAPQKPGFFARLKASFRRKESTVVEEAAIIQEIEQSQVHSDVYSEALDAPPAAREPFFSRIFASFRKQEEVPDSKEDMKSLGRSFFAILDRLPPEEKVKLKQQQEWKSIKDILRKHEVIR